MNSLSTASSNELRSPWPRTATNVISAIPIISAAAVEAVREGFRVALSRARSPATPPSFVPGQPSTNASGRTVRLAFRATPRKTISVPRASDPIRTTVASWWPKTP